MEIIGLGQVQVCTLSASFYWQMTASCKSACILSGKEDLSVVASLDVGRYVSDTKVFLKSRRK